MNADGRTVVVGGGIIGACSAYYLARAGRQVTLIDSAGFGSGCSRGNCGYICPSHVLPLAAPGALKTILGVLARPNSPVRMRPSVILRDPRWFLSFARRCNEADMLTAGGAIAGLLKSSRLLYSDLVRDERIDCEWEAKGLLFVFRTRSVMDHYAEVDHLIRERFETPAVRLDSAELARLEPSLSPGLAGAWLYEGDAQVRPDRLMEGLRGVLTRLGVEIVEHRRMTGLIRDGVMAVAVATDSGNIPAREVVVATGAWSPHLGSELGCRIPIQPGKGYSLTFPRLDNVPNHSMIFEEDRVAITPFLSGFRIGSMMEFVGHDTSIEPSRLRVLTETANKYLRRPITQPAEESWFGWRPMTPDGLPLIGPCPGFSNVFLAAGHNMLGLSMGTATGKLVSELVTGAKAHLDPSPYSVRRFA